MSITTFNGKRTDSRTAAMAAQAQRLFGKTLVVTQGSYNRTVSQSAGTHSGGGALDFSVSGLTPAKVSDLVLILRGVGFAAWHRSTAEGPWGAHIHAIAIGCPDLAPVARRQVDAYYDGGSGLASGTRDKHAWLNAPKRTWEQYRKLPLTPAYSGWRSLRAGSRDPFVKVVQVALGRKVTGVMTTADLAAVKEYRRTRPALWPARAAVGPLTARWLAGHPRVKVTWRR